jgi:hypothetical protein
VMVPPLLKVSFLCCTTQLSSAINARSLERSHHPEHKPWKGRSDALEIRQVASDRTRFALQPISLIGASTAWRGMAVTRSPTNWTRSPKGFRRIEVQDSNRDPAVLRYRKILLPPFGSRSAIPLCR